MSVIRRSLHGSENLLLAAALVAMVLLPLSESVLRAVFKTGISGASALLQHLTLVIGMIGGAVAARENRLLSIASEAMMKDGRLRTCSRLFGNAFASTITLFLAEAAREFVAAEREAGAILAYGIPIWVVQLVLPCGFLLIAVRLLYFAGETWMLRGAAVMIAALLATVALMPGVPAASKMTPALVGLLIATVSGSPVYAVLGGAALILFWGSGQTIASIPLDHYRLVINPSLPAIPLFTLAGYFLAEGGASKRLIRVFQSMFGGLRGGPAIVTALVCAFFTTFTGASGVTILALAGLLMPILVNAKYSERSALGLLTGAGSLGLLFPPCLPLILYAIVAKVQMQQMFLGGILPGVLLVLMTCWWGIRCGPAVTSGAGFRLAEARAALWEAKWDLLLPVVAIAGLYGGFATPVEAAAMTALYAFIAEALFYRDLTPSRSLKVLTECGLVIGGVLLILGVALGFTNYLVDAEIPARGVEWVTGAIQSPLVFLLLLNLFLLVVGCLMDIYSAILVVVPLIVPLGEAYQIHPVHLGIMFLANLELGYLTPPVGMNLFLASYRLGKPMAEVYRASFPMLMVLLVGVLMITYLPIMSTLLPGWLAR